VNTAVHKASDRSFIFTNPSNNSISISLGGKTYYDLDGNAKTGSIALSPWSSKILVLKSGYSVTTTSTSSARLVVEEEKEEKENKEELLVAPIKIFPNPSKGNVTISGGNEEINSIKVVNSFGENYFSKVDINQQEINIEGNGWPRGVYLVEVRLASGAKQYKRVILD